MDSRFLTPLEHRQVAAAADRLLPANGRHPGGAALGVADYVDTLLGAFTFDPPRIFAGGPFSGRAGGSAGFARFHALGPLEELGWRMRIEGSRGDPAREFNGPVRGWQEIYRDGLAALGDDFPDVAGEERDERLAGVPELRALLYEHACEGAYGPPEYGGNHDLGGWNASGFPGDVQPRGWTDDAVSGRA